MDKINLKTIKLTQLNPAPYNPRRISQEARMGLKNSLREFGVVQPIIWNKTTGNIVGGHQRFDVLMEEGIKETQVVVVELDEVKERALNVILNNRHISGDWDVPAVADVLSSLEGHIDFSDFGLDSLKDELGLNYDPFEGESEEDEPMFEEKKMICPECQYEFVA